MGRGVGRLRGRAHGRHQDQTGANASPGPARGHDADGGVPTMLGGMANMDRRRFLKIGASACAIPLASGRLAASAYASPLASLAAMAGNDRVLVVVRLDGGNDGLNTVLPLDQYAK